MPCHLRMSEVPKCVFAMKLPFTGVSTFPSALLTGPSFHIRSKPPIRFSFPVSLQYQIQGVKVHESWLCSYLIHCLHVGWKPVQIREKTKQLRAAMGSYLL